MTGVGAAAGGSSGVQCPRCQSLSHMAAQGRTSVGSAPLLKEPASPQTPDLLGSLLFRTTSSEAGPAGCPVPGPTTSSSAPSTSSAPTAPPDPDSSPLPTAIPPLARPRALANQQWLQAKTVTMVGPGQTSCDHPPLLDETKGAALRKQATCTALPPSCSSSSGGGNNCGPGSPTSRKTRSCSDLGGGGASSCFGPAQWDTPQGTFASLPQLLRASLWGFPSPDLEAAALRYQAEEGVSYDFCATSFVTVLLVIMATRMFAEGCRWGGSVGPHARMLMCHAWPCFAPLPTMRQTCLCCHPTLGPRAHTPAEPDPCMLPTSDAQGSVALTPHNHHPAGLLASTWACPCMRCRRASAWELGCSHQHPREPGGGPSSQRSRRCWTLCTWRCLLRACCSFRPASCSSSAPRGSTWGARASSAYWWPG